MLKLSNIHFSYGETKVLKGIDLDVKKGRNSFHCWIFQEQEKQLYYIF